MLRVGDAETGFVRRNQWVVAPEEGGGGRERERERQRELWSNYAGMSLWRGFLGDEPRGKRMKMLRRPSSTRMDGSPARGGKSGYRACSADGKGCRLEGGSWMKGQIETWLG